MLDDLVGVIETLQGRIEQHRPALIQSEALTRYALIDPLLRALGWDTADPALVTPEYRVGTKSADYALLKSDGVAVFLEAKRLDENLPPHRSQVAAYASELGIRYPALTNGNEWEVYDNSQLVPIDQRRILSVSLAGAPAAVNALQLLLLWRPNLATGEPVAAREPILAVPAAVPVAPTPVPPAVDVRPAVIPPPISAEWSQLSNFQYQSGQKAPAMRLPDGVEKTPRYWVEVLVEVAEYLVRTSHLTADRCPISAPASTRHIVHRDSVHSNGKDFIYSRPLSNGLFCEVNVSGATAVRYAKALLEHFGVDAGAVWLKLG